MTDDSGVVCGASGTRPDGTTVSVNAKAVVIATGGYAANTELVEEYTGKTGYVTQVPAGNVGDGLMMAEAVGAAIYKPTTIQTVFTSFTCGVGINEEAGLIVNSRGERVVNEYTYQYHVAEAIINSGCYSGWYIASAADPNPMVQYGITLDSTLKAATAEELGELMGVDPEAFAAVVERYNELCAKGSDDDFGKPADKMIPLEGELYAILLSPAATVLLRRAGDRHRLARFEHRERAHRKPVRRGRGGVYPACSARNTPAAAWPSAARCALAALRAQWRRRSNKRRRAGLPFARGLPRFPPASPFAAGGRQKNSAQRRL